MRARVLIAGTGARLPSEGVGLAVVLAVAARGGSAAFAGLVVALTTLPQIFTGPAGGVLLDRADRPERVLAGSAALAAVALAVLAATDVRGPAAIAAALAVAVVDPVLTGGLSAVFTRWGDVAMSAWDGVAYNIAGVGAPLLVTVVAATAGPPAALWVLAGVAVAAAAALLGSPRVTPAVHAGPRVRAALRAMWQHGPLRGVTIATTIETGALGGLALALVAAAAAHEHAAEAAGVVLTVRAVAALASSLALTRWGRAVPPHRLVVGSIALSGAGLVAMGLAPWWLLVVLGAATGLADGPVLVGTYRARVDGSPDGVRAAVFTVGASLKLAASSAGALVAGLALADRESAAGLVAIGAVCVVAAAAGWAFGRDQTG